MHPTARRRCVALTAVFASVALNCGLINPLDHLQAGRDAEAVSLAACDGAAVGADGGIFEDGARVDADDGPCSKSPWLDCGVIVIATPQDPGDAIFGLASNEVHYSDTATGELFTTTCTSAACTAPTRVVGG